MKDILLVLTLAKKEARSLFLSPFNYCLMAVYIFVIGWTFYNSLIYLQNEPQASLDEQVLAPFLGNLSFIFFLITPMLTMESFSKEYRQGTINFLLNSSLDFRHIIWGKFLALCVVFFSYLLLTSIFPLILIAEKLIDIRIVFTGMLGVSLTVFALLSSGLFISSLTQNVVASSLGTFFFLLMSLLLAQSLYVLDNPLVSQMLSFLSPPFHLAAFTRGMIQSFDLVYFFSWIFFFLYATELSLEVRYW